MNTQHEIDRQFRELNDSIIKEYEERLGRWQETLKRQQGRLQADEKDAREILDSSGLDLNRLDQRVQRSSGDLKAYLDRVRPILVDRPARRAEGFKERSLIASASGSSNRRQFPPYGASVMARDKSYLAGIEGEMGNPWVLPFNPGEINLKDTSTGSGWGCWAEAVGPPPTYNIWFFFTPDQTALWELTAILAFHGFYILRADDTIFTCKWTEAHVEVKLNVFQYFWHGEKTYKLIDIDEDDIEDHIFFDRTEFLWTQTNLKAGDPVWVLAQVSIDAYAKGGGSYSEVNFSDGTANYIQPLLLSAGPL